MGTSLLFHSTECLRLHKYRPLSQFLRVLLRTHKGCDDNHRPFYKIIQTCFHHKVSSICPHQWVFIQISCRVKWRKCRKSEFLIEFMIQQTTNSKEKPLQEVLTTHFLLCHYNINSNCKPLSLNLNRTYSKFHSNQHSYNHLLSCKWLQSRLKEERKYSSFK